MGAVARGTRPGRRRTPARLDAGLPADRLEHRAQGRRDRRPARQRRRAVGLSVEHDPLLGEIDRSATGYLPPSEFEAVVDAFFARPEQSVRGWERAIDAQERIVAAVRRHCSTGDLTIVSHGAVGALLLAHLRGVPITRALDQPGMGSVFRFDAPAWRATSGWRRVPAT